MPPSYNIKPQLAKTYDPERFLWSKAYLLEPKLDGLRCIVVARRLQEVLEITPFSRTGKPLWNMEHITNEIKNNWVHKGDWVLDGEAYTTSCMRSMSITKSSKSTPTYSGDLRLHVWDAIPLCYWKKDVYEVSQRLRKIVLENLIDHTTHDFKFTKVVPGVMVSSHEQCMTEYANFLAAGYEGGMLKDPDASYELDKRSKAWLKIKPWTDADLTIVNAFEGNGKHQGRLGKIALEGEAEWKGETYNVVTECGTGFSDEQRESYWKEWNEGTLKGQVAEITFQDITEDRACRFPVFKKIRIDK